MNNITKQERLEALDTLLNARMAHTRWVAEVVHAASPCVVEDHRDCQFGKWLLAAGSTLGTVPQFADLVEPHRQLHEVYRALKDGGDPEAVRSRVRELSRLLIERIDLLEKRLNKPVT